jgi:hypothetical protein
MAHSASARISLRIRDRRRSSLLRAVAQRGRLVLWAAPWRVLRFFFFSRRFRFFLRLLSLLLLPASLGAASVGGCAASLSAVFSSFLIVKSVGLCVCMAAASVLCRTIIGLLFGSLERCVALNSERYQDMTDR